MLIDHFPLVGLRLTTPRLELRLPSPEELAELADVAAEGIHDAGDSPFLVRWTDAPPAEAARSVIQRHWRLLGAWTPRDWTLNLVVFRSGTVVGLQVLAARELSVTRQVRTTSWLGRRHQGQGIGTEMRAAVLHLAFAGLDAEEALSGALAHNAASLAVSRKLGYRHDGHQRHALDGRLVMEERLRLTRDDWDRHRTVPVGVHGLAPCLPLLGGQM
ncbi:GNAT family N-acetyltransferase [Nonomuraea sp. NPDC023979]|uniref:GNAT family N-acetyltransferase n=1 Tax=Nonomuraea sp. NPDC023979 TaxID=3154796 RepID=UPI0033E86085